MAQGMGGNPSLDRRELLLLGSHYSQDTNITPA